MTNIT